MPYDGGNYELAPYEEITEEQYTQELDGFPKIDYSKLVDFEDYDMGEGSFEIACTGGSCEL